MTTAIEQSTAIRPRPAAITPVVMMNQTEARGSILHMRADLEQVDMSLTNFRRRALEFKEREGWRALGYGGYLEAIQHELKAELSRSYISRLVQAAEVERDLDLPIGKEIPESQLRPLAELESPEERREAWDLVSERTNGKPTAKQVEQAAAEIAARRCGRCEQPSDDRVSYGPGIVPEYPNGITLCPRCVSALLRERSTTNGKPTNAAPICEDCGAAATNKRTIGGWSAQRCDACTIKAAEQNAADQAEATPAAGPLAEMTALCDRAERLGAQIEYLEGRNPAKVRVTAPANHQQRPLDCNAADLRYLVEAWEGHAKPQPSRTDAISCVSIDRAALLRHWRAVESALDQWDLVGALVSIRAIVAMIEEGMGL